MRRDVYLSEYESMTFKERFYIYRKNRMSINLKRFIPPSPLDWSVRVVFRGVMNLISLPVYFLLYIPVSIAGARDLKVRYANEKWKRSTHHKNLNVLR